MKKLAYIFLVPFLLVSCMKELDGGQEPGRLDFRVSLESFKHTSTKAGEPVELKGGDVKMYLIPEVKEWSAPATKGTIVEDASSVEGFFLFGYRYDDNHEWTGVEEERNLFDAEYVTRRNGSFVMDHPKLWASSDSPQKQRFFAFAASREGDSSGSNSFGSGASGHHLNYVDADSNNGSGIPSIYYGVACNEEVSSQEDILYALSPESKYTQGGNGVVDLTFSHALTAVKFSVEDFGVPAVIKRVSISNVYRDGIFKFDGSDFLWDTSSSDGSSSYTFSASLADDSDGVSVGRTGESELTGGEATFLMIPQECYSGSEVNIEFEHDGKMFSLYASLEGQVWEMGKEIEYKISLTDGTYHLDVSSPEAFTQKGVAETIPDLFNVKSYIQYAGGVKEALPWSIYGYSEDGGTTWTDIRPTWLTALTKSGLGNYVSGDAVSGSVVADRDSYEALVRLHIDEHTSTYVDVLVEKQGEEPLTFTIVTGGNIVWKCSSSNASYARTISYKKNDGDWQEITSTVSGVSIPVEAGDVLKFKGENVSYAVKNSVANSSGIIYLLGYNSFGVSGGATFDASGSILSLLIDGVINQQVAFSSLFYGNAGMLSAPDLPAEVLRDGCYSSIFYGCTSLVHAPRIIMNSETYVPQDCFRSAFDGCTSLVDAPELLASELSTNAYYRMFNRCIKLVSAPELPAEIVSPQCYYQMFYGCTSLVNGPSCLPDLTLPANPNISFGCYDSMFYGCSKLVNAPVLPATVLSKNCYSNMFSGCSSLTNAPDLPATTLADYCYSSMFNGCTSLTTAPALPATSMARGCYGAMFARCTNLTTAPVLPATSLAFGCYNSMFSGCTSLTSAPELPALVMEESCYSGMFQGCTGLNAAPELHSESLAKSCYSGMFSGCTSLSSAPELPASQLSDYCYQEMFQNCRNLTAAPMLASVDLANYCYSRMFYGCVKLGAAPLLPASVLKPFCYREMFLGCIQITNTLELPALIMEESCYEGMFQGCTSLTSAPELPAMTLAKCCYRQMFFGCTGITVAPVLPATTLDYMCYEGMFNGSCITNAPVLPATTMKPFCYRYMFKGSSLSVPPVLPATTLDSWCYTGMFTDCRHLVNAPALPATVLADCCYMDMFSGCWGLVSAPVLPATTLADRCYYQMFEECRALTTAPELPASSLVSYCYYRMFERCYSLSEVKCLATDISASNSVSYFLNQAGSYVHGTKTFYKHPDMSDWPVGDSGIPSGWTIVDATL